MLLSLLKCLPFIIDLPDEHFKATSIDSNDESSVAFTPLNLQLGDNTFHKSSSHT